MLEGSGKADHALLKYILIALWGPCMQSPLYLLNKYCLYVLDHLPAPYYLHLVKVVKVGIEKLMYNNYVFKTDLACQYRLSKSHVTTISPLFKWL